MRWCHEIVGAQVAAPDPGPSKLGPYKMNQRGSYHAMVIFLWLAMCASLSLQAAEPPEARTSFNAGLQAFAASNYPAATNAFLAAAAAAPAAKLDPAAAYYNAGLAAYAGRDLKSAADSFARAVSGADLGLQARAYYNRGNALFHQAGGPAGMLQAGATPLPAMSTQELASAESSVGEAVQMYENAIALNPKDVDAKANYELAVLKQQQLQQQKQQQEQQQKQDQQKQDQQKQNPQNQKPEDQKDQQNQQQQQQQQQAEQKPQPQSQENQQSQKEQSQPDKPSEEMTPEEAAMMLDAMKAQEQSQRDQLHPFFGRPVPVEKDW